MVYAEQAVAMARRFGDPELVAYSLRDCSSPFPGPEYAEQRLTIATEILDLPRRRTPQRNWCQRTLAGVGIACSSWEIWRQADAEYDA